MKLSYFFIPVLCFTSAFSYPARASVTIRVERDLQTGKEQQGLSLSSTAHLSRNSNFAMAPASTVGLGEWSAELRGKSKLRSIRDELLQIQKRIPGKDSSFLPLSASPHRFRVYLGGNELRIDSVYGKRVLQIMRDIDDAAKWKPLHQVRIELISEDALQARREEEKVPAAFIECRRLDETLVSCADPLYGIAYFSVKKKK